MTICKQKLSWNRGRARGRRKGKKCSKIYAFHFIHISTVYMLWTQYNGARLNCIMPCITLTFIVFWGRCKNIIYTKICCTHFMWIYVLHHMLHAFRTTSNGNHNNKIALCISIGPSTKRLHVVWVATSATAAAAQRQWLLICYWIKVHAFGGRVYCMCVCLFTVLCYNIPYDQ